MLTLVCFGGLPGTVPPPRINDISYSYKGKRQMARFKVSSLFLQAVAGLAVVGMTASANAGWWHHGSSGGSRANRPVVPPLAGVPVAAPRAEMAGVAVADIPVVGVPAAAPRVAGAAVADPVAGCSITASGATAPRVVGVAAADRAAATVVRAADPRAAACTMLRWKAASPLSTLRLIPPFRLRPHLHRLRLLAIKRKPRSATSMACWPSKSPRTPRFS